MQRQDNHWADSPNPGTPERPVQPERSLVNEDCVIMLEAIRQRATGLVAPLANGHASARLPADHAFTSRKALEECEAALGKLLVMVSPQRANAEQLVLDVAELRIVLSAAHKRL